MGYKREVKAAAWRVGLVLLGLGVAVSVNSAEAVKGKPGGAQESAPAVADKAAKAKPKEPDVVMARVGTKDITMPEYLTFLMRDSRFVEMSKTVDGQAQILRELIRAVLTREAIYREGILTMADKPTQTMVNKAEIRLAQMRYPYPPEPPEAEVRAYFDANKEVFGIPEKVRITQIQVRFPTGATPVQKRLTYEKTAGLLARVEKGESFADLAGEYTENASAKAKKGDLGFLPRNLDPWLKRALTGVSVGGHTGVLESPIGYEILRITDLTPASLPGYDQARGAVIERMRVERQIKAREAYLHGVAQEVGVKILVPELADAMP